MRDAGFKYKVGDLVTHVGFLKPVRQPRVPRFRIVTQTLIAGPASTQRMYTICPVHGADEPPSSSLDTLRVQEEHLALWSNDN